MKDNHILTLLQDNYKTVKVIFPDSGRSKAYTFKTNIEDIKPEDFVIVESNYSDTGYAIVKVESVDEEPDIDTDREYAYRWIVCKIDIEKYQETIEKEKALLKQIRHIRKSQIKNNFVKQLTEIYGEEEIKALQETIKKGGF